MDVYDVIRFINTAETCELYELRTALDERIKFKEDEPRTRMLQVRDESMIFAYFRENEMKEALEYAATKTSSIAGNFHIEVIRVRNSEVEGRLVDRW